MSIKKYFKKKNGWKFLAVVVLLGLIFACSIDIVSIDQPSEADAGSGMTVTVNCKIDPAGTNNGSTLVVGFLVPKSWNAKQNTSAFYTCIPMGADNEKMSLMPVSERESKTQLPWADALMSDKRYALMGNIVSDMEWVVFRSTKTYDVNSGITFTLRIVTKVGEENMLVNLGYFIGNANDGLAAPGNDKYHDGKYARLTVVNGTGDVIDFVNPQIAMMELAKATDNDIQTIFYDGDLVETPLSSESKIYLCAKAYTSSGTVIERCERTDRSAFKPMAGINRFRFDFWPRSYFGLTETQTLQRMEYFLTDATGTKKIGYGGSTAETDPFRFAFNCQ